MGAASLTSDRAPRTGYITSLNPATGEVLGEVPEQGPAEVRATVARAREAQRLWGELPVAERARRVLRLRDALSERAEDLCDLISRETGKTRGEALMMEVAPIIDLATWFARRASDILAPRRIPLHLLKTRASYLHHVPRGVVGVIAPWNFPFAIAMGEVVMALLAGNAAVLKPSELAPLVALKAKELFDGAELPGDLFQVVTGRGEAGAALLEAGIDFCSFTGSTATGRKVAAACGERLIPCTLELGGKAAAIVCPDADVERTARALCWGAFANSGQVCVSVERVYAHEAVYDELCDRAAAIARGLRQGDPSRGEVDVGAITWERQLEHVEARVREGRRRGRAAARRGRRGDGPGLFYQPTVLGDCRHEMAVMRDEVFGPVLPIARVPSVEEALRLSNDSPLGLMGYVFTGDGARGRRIAERMETGMVMINDVLLVHATPETPWQGTRRSGLGRTHSADGLRDLCVARHVNYDRIRLRRELWWYPYSQVTYRAALRALRYLFR